jgi:hypothetical protein
MSNSIKTFKKIGQSDPNVSKFQDNVESAINPVLNSSIIDGVLIKNVTLTPLIRNEVLHQLQRAPLGYIIVRKRQDSRIWDLQDSNTATTRTFTLACSHTTCVDIWFF